jgi:site-specific recombinase XerD
MPLRKGTAVVTAVNTLTGYHTLVRSFERSLLASNFSPHTVRLYMSVLRRFGEFLVERGMPINVDSITREHVEEYLAETLRTKKANTATNRHKALRAFFNWLVEEGAIRGRPCRTSSRRASPRSRRQC